MRLTEKRRTRGLRFVVPEPELRELLSLAFERIRPLQCRSCTLPAPLRVDRDCDDTANWMLPVIAQCPHNCTGFVRWLSLQYGRQYDLAEER